MHIEFHNPQAQVKKWVLDYVTEKLIELYQRDRQIVSAGVYYRESVDGGNHDKVCEVVLASYSHSLFVHRRSGSFEQASKDAVADLTQKIEQERRAVHTVCS